jgi:hypothetical protein
MTGSPSSRPAKIDYSIRSYAFGRKDLPQIQGAAHVVTITA